MNEFFLIVSFLLIIILAPFILKKYTPKKVFKIRIIVGVLFLILIWFLGNDAKFSYKAILTLVLVYSLYWTYKDVYRGNNKSQS